MARAHHRLSVIAGHLYNSALPSRVSREDCCGIVGVIGQETPVINYLLEGLKILEARGYDSAGITTLKNQEFITTKFASSGSTSNAIQILEQHAHEHKGNTIGMNRPTRIFLTW